MQSVGGSRDKMSTKRRASKSSDEEAEVPEKRSRRRRSRSEPTNTDATDSSDAIESTDSDDASHEAHRLFGGFCNHGVSNSDESVGGEDEEDYLEDPLLIDAVPECLDPEQLGFLVCAQETLSFLRGTGMTHHNLVYEHLRSHFLTTIRQLGIA